MAPKVKRAPSRDWSKQDDVTIDDVTRYAVERKAPHSLFDRPELLSSSADEAPWTVERWIAEATFFVGPCPRCTHGTIGEYVPTNREGDCGIVEKCRLCSWEVVRIRGRHRVPVEWRL